MILSLLLSLILIGLAIIHFSWVFGGTFCFAQSIPTKENGGRLFNPKKIDSAVVGIVLTLFGIFYILKSGIFEVYPPEWLMKYGSWVIPSLFILRAIGEFKYVGFFKTIKNTAFAKVDSKIFSPLCLLIGILGVVVSISKISF